MPRLRLREYRLPELELPEMSRDDILRVVNDARRDVDLGRLDPRRLDLPDMDLRKLDRPKIELSRADLPKIDLSRLDLSRVDLPKALATAAQAAGIVRASRRSRLPFVVGGVATVAIVGIAILSSPMVRPRLTELMRRARERYDARRAGETTDDIIGIAIEPTAYETPSPEPAATTSTIPTPADELVVDEPTGIATA